MAPTVTWVHPEIALQISRDLVAGKQQRIDKLEAVIRAILVADERGQGLPFAEAMEEAARLVKWDEFRTTAMRPPETRRG